MMRVSVEDLKVYLYRAPIDMRKGRNALATLAREAMLADPFDGSLFVYIGRRYDAIKLIYWDINGFAVWQKWIESEEKFHWPRLFEEEVVTLTSEQLNWLLDGQNVWARAHRPITFKHVS